MVRINPGSNVHGDNKTGTATPGMQNVTIPEPKIVEKNRYQCPVCDRIFDSREEYISHAMARHQTAPEEISPQSSVAASTQRSSMTTFECETT